MKVLTKVLKRASGSVLMLFLLVPLTVFAQTRAVVIPLFGDDLKPLKNIVTVAKANGDFKDPVAAVNSISDASADNPFLVVIGPGVYTITQTLVMKEYVDITGSGENVTKIKGAISTGNIHASSIISGVTNCTLSSLSVENTGGGEKSIALYNANTSPRLIRITAKASGGSNNYGVYNFSSSSPTMTDVTAVASGGEYSYGVHNFSSSFPKMTGVTAAASGATRNYGVYNSSSSPTMTDVTATASGGTYNFGVYNNSSSSPTMTGVTAVAFGGESSEGVHNDSSSPTMTALIATASGGTNRNVGLYSSGSSSPKVRRSTIEGETSLFSVSSSTVTFSQSTLIGGVGGTGTNKCVACDDAAGTKLGANCLAP